MSDIAPTLGALLVGGSIALFLSGILSVQCIVYFKLYLNDASRCRFTVVVVWILDLLHSAFIVTALYDYFISFFGDSSRIAIIPWSIALSVLITAIQTAIVHGYFAEKIHTSSGKNWWITAPIAVLAFLRVLAASTSTAEMIRLGRYAVFNNNYPGWIFTTGLSLSAAVDIIITAWLCYFLQKMRRRTASTIMAHVVNTVTLYTLENGFITCLTTTASLICWLTMPNNLVFMGLHFIISKLYVNSLLISLNTRKELRETRWNKTDWAPNNPVLSGSGSGSGELSSMQYAQSYNPVASMTMMSPSHTYQPAFKQVTPTHRHSGTLGVVAERSVSRASDEISDLSRSEYREGRYHPRPRSPRHTSEPWRSLP